MACARQSRTELQKLVAKASRQQSDCLSSLPVSVFLFTVVWGILFINTTLLLNKHGADPKFGSLEFKILIACLIPSNLSMIKDENSLHSLVDWSTGVFGFYQRLKLRLVQYSFY